MKKLYTINKDHEVVEFIRQALKLFDIKPDTLQKIKKQVEEADLEVKEITFIDKKK